MSRRSDDPERFRAWLNDPVTKEVFDAARETLVQSMEAPTAPGDEEATDRVLDLATRLQVLAWIRRIATVATNREQLAAGIAARQMPDAEPRAGEPH
ncbi:MAG: hypothetical protein V2J24_23625 [Pseudomonadales bacterium]|jgi:hypothetical protein|nr:hypothetical protein [Pseudomonadales bacterium]